ncbi:hypothetical protein J3P85_22235 [Pseudomonas sp. Z1-12]|uniref:type II toxin-antitoxin system Phd/YefM family antitoxin n=1 Tax=Pseudomonas sp. Z1-12 TaxID=2817408 RepID=UPI003DA95571
MSEQVQVTLQETKSHLLQLGARAWLGDKVVITNAGKPYLDLLPMSIRFRRASLDG